MGYTVHNSIVVMSWKLDVIAEVRAKAVEIGLTVSELVSSPLNGWLSFLVASDGSKEGWDDARIADDQRRRFRELLSSHQYSDGSSCLDWFEVESGDTCPRVIERERPKPGTELHQWQDDREQERARVLELLATALDIKRPHADLHQRKGALKFLAEELIAERDRLLASFVEDHGGAPAQGPDGAHWHLVKQFTSDVWDEHSPAHKLNLRVVAVNRAAVADFVAELRDWSAFTERSVLDIHLPRESLGRQVRDVWVDWACEQPDPKPSWLLKWEALGESDREVDRRIGETLYQAGFAAAQKQLRVAEAEHSQCYREALRQEEALDKAKVLIDALLPHAEAALLASVGLSPFRMEEIIASWRASRSGLVAAAKAPALTCVCGHPKSVHYDDSDGMITEGSCQAGRQTGIRCDCEAYQQQLSERP